MMRDGTVFDDHMLLALRRIRVNGRYRLIALTNNFSGLLDRAAIPKSELAFLGWQNGPAPPHLRALFDGFCDSSVLGMRCVVDASVLGVCPLELTKGTSPFFPGSRILHSTSLRVNATVSAPMRPCSWMIFVSKCPLDSPVRSACR
jgi:hypothetical protein